jgi:sugar/nucleoside kinase (ribokinase family)
VTKLQVVGLGMAILDVLIRQREMSTWEQGSRISAFALQGGGPVGTAIVAAAKLGARCGLVGIAGTDNLAEIKLASFVEFGVDLSHLVRREGPERSIVIVYVQEDTGERTFSGYHRLEDMAVKPEELDRDYITQAEYLHLDGSHPQAAVQAAKWMKEAGKKVMLDGSKTDGRPVGDHMRALIPYVDVLICGSGFGRSLTGIADTWGAGDAMLAMGPSIAVQTEGAAGSYTSTVHQRIHVPAYDIKVLDTTGAGDVFHGAYLVGLLHGWDLETIAHFCTAVSAIKCTKLGGRAGIPCMDEVRAFLSARGVNLS